MTGISSDQEHQIKELIAKGQKIAAVKLYRELTNVGLKEAKDAVEAIERGELAYFHSSIQSDQEIDMVLEDQIRQLLAKRQKIQAVKVYREAHNCGLKEAKDAVDAMEAKMRRGTHLSLPSSPAISNDPFAEYTEQNRRYFVLVFVLLVMVLGTIVYFFLMWN